MTKPAIVETDEHIYDRRMTDDMMDGEYRTLYCHGCHTYHKTFFREKTVYTIFENAPFPVQGGK